MDALEALAVRRDQDADTVDDRLDALRREPLRPGLRLDRQHVVHVHRVRAVGVSARARHHLMPA
jgi:hypothetical protein